MSTTNHTTTTASRFSRLRCWWNSPSPLLQAGDARLTRAQLACLVAGLMLLTIVPRALAAAQLVSVCNDGYYYNWTAEMLARGEFEKPLAYLNINIYPMILWGLRSAGWDPLEAGKWWGVIVSGLTIIPLFVLLRRLIDTRIAIAGCFLFAIHPELIEISIEPIREVTFWFFLVATLALLHKAGETGGWTWPALAGLAFTLAVHTRTEGWALLAPLFVWIVWKPATVRSQGFQKSLGSYGLSRGRWLRAGFVLAMIPLFLIVVNLTVLREHDEFEWGRFTAVRNFVEWIAGIESRERLALAPLLADTDAQSRTFAGRSVLFVKESVEEFEYLNVCLLLFGLLTLRSRILSRELLPLTLIFAGQMLAVWVRLMQIGNINGRYFLTAYLMAVPTAACGVLYLLAVLRRRAKWSTNPRLRFGVYTGVAAAAMVAISWIDALDSPHESRRRELDLGRQLGREFAAVRHVETDLLSARTGYAVRGESPYVEEYHGGRHADRPVPDLLIIRERSLDHFSGRIREAGLVPLPPVAVSGRRRGADYRIFVRPQAPVRIVERPD